ncbi:MAG: nucleoside transporter C-terminal domain-containing protein [Planctomycetaceae bacterium]|nr:nucleoside transporter C-terminal domain-containing protein [Planctomycetaceae bacterium]
MTAELAEASPPPVLAETPRSWRIVIAIFIGFVTIVAYATQTVIGPRGQACAGVICFIGIVAMCSQNLRAINWRTVGWGMFLQVALAFFILKFQLPGRPEGMSLGTWLSHAVTLTATDAPAWRPGYAIFETLGAIISRFLDFSSEGAKFVFGPLANPGVMTGVFPQGGFVFAFVALPTIIFVSSFFTVLYYLGVLQAIVRVTAKGMIYAMQTSGAETLSAVANVFMGQTEAPLIVKPYVAGMTKSELLAMMVGGMATIAGGVMAVYIQMGADPVAILATSVMAAPCGLYLAKIMLPETEIPDTIGGKTVHVAAPHRNVIDAAADGASEGMKLAINVAAMLIAFLAFIALFDALAAGTKPALLWCGVPTDWLMFWPDNLNLAMVFSWAFAPLAFLMGAEATDLLPLADLLGTKLVTNEFVAYVKLTSLESNGGYRDILTPRGYVLATYALTGFANLSSIGIQLGGIGAMAPERRSDLASLGARALLVGFLATMINASIAGMMLATGP